MEKSHANLSLINFFSTLSKFFFISRFSWHNIRTGAIFFYAGLKNVCVYVFSAGNLHFKKYLRKEKVKDHRYTIE